MPAKSTAAAWSDPVFAEKYAQNVDQQPYNALYERPALQKLLPDLAGIKVLDAGCAAGGLSEWMLGEGAEVIAIDRSPVMVAAARKRLGDRAKVTQADLGEPLAEIDDAELNLVVSSLTLHYLDEWQPVMAEFFRVLRPGGQLVFSTHHPIADFSASENGNYFEVEYLVEHWSGFTREPFPVAVFRRSLSAIVSAPQQAGLILEQIVEPKPLPQMQSIAPKSYARLMKRPEFILLRFVKPISAVAP